MELSTRFTQESSCPYHRQVLDVPIGSNTAALSTFGKGRHRTYRAERAGAFLVRPERGDVQPPSEGLTVCRHDAPRSSRTRDGVQHFEGEHRRLAFGGSGPCT